MISIAIDGPSGAGKSTLAKAAAKELGYLYVDTGALYRTVAYAMLSRGIAPKDEEKVAEELSRLNLQLKYNEQGEQQIYLNGENVTEFIRSPQVSEGSSQVSVHPSVRRWLLHTQRDLARTHNVIMDGRDIGTVVLPQADVKIFLSADPEARARRRHLEYVAKGEEIGYNQVLEHLLERDHRDTTRKVSPLKQSEDGILLDSTNLTFEETLTALLRIIKENINE